MFLTVKPAVPTPYIPLMEFEELNTKCCTHIPKKEL